MLANGSDWSSLLRTTSQGCVPSGRRGCSFMVVFLSVYLCLIWGAPERRFSMLLTMRPSSLRAFPDGDAPAGQFHGLLGELHVGDLLDGRLLARFDVAVLDAVVDRPLRALWIEPGVDRPH